MLPAAGYLVIAKNAARLLMTNYPASDGANTLGDFNGTLAARRRASCPFHARRK